VRPDNPPAKTQPAPRAQPQPREPRAQPPTKPVRPDNPPGGKGKGKKP
jgi:hypothetical protein